jgi:hypothetical protein
MRGAAECRALCAGWATPAWRGDAWWSRRMKARRDTRRNELDARVEDLTSELGELDLLYLRECITAKLVENRRLERQSTRTGRGVVARGGDREGDQGSPIDGA